MFDVGGSVTDLKAGTTHVSREENEALEIVTQIKVVLNVKVITYRDQPPKKHIHAIIDGER